MFAFCQGQEWESSLESAMWPLTDLYTLDGLVMATSRGLRWTSALATLARPGSGSGWAPERSLVSSTAMLGAFSKTLKWTLALELLLGSKLQRITLDAQAHAVALSALGSAWRRVMGLLPKNGGGVSVSAQEVAIQACSMATQRQQAMEMFYKLPSPSLGSFNMLLTAQASWEDALQLLSKSEEMSILPSCVSVLAVAEGLFARPVLSRLQGYLHAPSSQELNALISAADLLEERQALDAASEGAWHRRVGRAQVAELLRLKKGAPLQLARAKFHRLRSPVLEQQHSLGRGTQQVLGLLGLDGSQSIQWVTFGRQQLRRCYHHRSTVNLKASGQMAYLAFRGKNRCFAFPVGPGRLASN